MTMPRSSLVSLTDTPWYHVVCRCVRRAFLCGEDHTTGQNFEHRRGWIEERIGQLSSVFAIDVAAYTVMSNHYHIVVRIDDKRAQQWSDYEVLKRWTKIFAGPLFVQRYLDKDQRQNLSDAQLSQVDKYIELYRQRLSDLSWYMRVLNETIARKANAEDNCTGRFWEGRFTKHYSNMLQDTHKANNQSNLLSPIQSPLLVTTPCGGFVYWWACGWAGAGLAVGPEASNQSIGHPQS
jgi:hypothetical protein